MLREANIRINKMTTKILAQSNYSRQPSSIIGHAMLGKSRVKGIRQKPLSINPDNPPTSMSEVHKLQDDGRQTDKSNSKNGGRPANHKSIYRSKFDKKGIDQKKLQVQNLNAFLLDSIAYTKNFRVP
jgi:hypothetical protein